MMRFARWTSIAIATAACSGATVGGLGSDGGGDAARFDAPSGDDASTADAGYLACMDSQGHVDPSLKHCTSDADCTYSAEQTDCCGTVLYVGLAKSAAPGFAACEAAWVNHFPGCGCYSDRVETEDGKTDADGAAPRVHCIDFTSNGGVCMTYLP